MSRKPILKIYSNYLSSGGRKCDFVRLLCNGIRLLREVNVNLLDHFTKILSVYLIISN